MIVVKTLTEPVTVDLSDRYAGVKVTLRRLMSPDLEEARQAALLVLRSVRDSGEALKPYGLAEADANGVRLNPADPMQMSRVGQLIETVEVAVRAVVSWEGVVGEDRQPAPVSREVLSVLLLDDAFGRRLRREIEAAARILVVEGNA